MADLAFGDVDLQDAIIAARGVPPLLSILQYGRSLAQEFAARTIWYLSTTIDNQHVLLEDRCIGRLIERQDIDLGGGALLLLLC